MNGFEAGYGLHAVVPDDMALAHPQDLNVTERLERTVLNGPCICEWTNTGFGPDMLPVSR